MLRFKGETFQQIAHLLGILKGTHTGHDLAKKLIAEVPVSGMSKSEVEERIDEFPKAAVDIFKGQFDEWEAALKEAQLEMSLHSFSRLRSLCAREKISFSHLDQLADELALRIEEELSHFALWQITREEARFLEPDPFGAEITSRFRSARDDIEEAGRCLAFGRGTAVVFHLMRVTEVGLRALGASLEDPTLDPKRNPTWETILGRCDGELKKPLKERRPTWRADENFYSTATANLRAVKDSWRNPTLHIERRYSPEEAAEVWNAVRAFIGHLAKKLSDASTSSGLVP